MLLTLPDIALHCEQHGHGEPVVFVNGIMMSARSWQPQTAALSPHWRCIHYDLRGQLMSDKPPGDYAFALHVADLLALLDRLDLPRVHLVGISYGGAIAQLFTALHPQRVRSLALIATTAEADGLHRQRFQAWVDILDTRPRELFTFSLHENYSAEFIGAHGAELERVEAWFRARDDAYFAGLRRLVPAMRDVNLRPHLASIECPTLVVAAERDGLLGCEAGCRLATQIGGARLEKIAGGHAITLEQPAVVNAILLDFLRGQEEAMYGEG